MDDFTNLLEETLQRLTQNGKTEEDISYVSYAYRDEETHNYEKVEKFLSLADFKIIAQCIDYDAGYGGVCIDSSLKIVGENFWLEREEYDGAEGWSYKTFPQKPVMEGDILEPEMYKKIICSDSNDFRLNSLEDTLKTLREKRLIEENISPDNLALNKTILKI